LWTRYRFTDIGFQDETFFTHTDRVAAIADEILRRDLEFTWMATMRADQGARLDDRVLVACQHAGLRRVMVGLESGSQAMLDWMKKDAKVDQALVTAEKCRRHGIGVLFNLIVGFPNEPGESIAATLAVAKTLRDFGPKFQVALFYYRPYPGTPITDELARSGFPFAARLTRVGGDRAPQLAESVGGRRQAEADRAFSFLSKSWLGEAVGVAEADPGRGAVAVPA
jgi:radical SAM superfamily enzyme YgiQ (UPF0313 family)